MISSEKEPPAQTGVACFRRGWLQHAREELISTRSEARRSRGNTKRLQELRYRQQEFQSHLQTEGSCLRELEQHTSVRADTERRYFYEIWLTSLENLELLNQLLDECQDDEQVENNIITEEGLSDTENEPLFKRCRLNSSPTSFTELQSRSDQNRSNSVDWKVPEELSNAFNQAIFRSSANLRKSLKQHSFGMDCDSLGIEAAKNQMNDSAEVLLKKPNNETRINATISPGKSLVPAETDDEYESGAFPSSLLISNGTPNRRRRRFKPQQKKLCLVPGDVGYVSGSSPKHSSTSGGSGGDEFREDPLIDFSLSNRVEQDQNNRLMVRSYYKTVPLDDQGMTDIDNDDGTGTFLSYDMLSADEGLQQKTKSISPANNKLSESMIVHVEHDDDEGQPLFSQDYDEIMGLMDDDERQFYKSWKSSLKHLVTKTLAQGRRKNITQSYSDRKCYRKILFEQCNAKQNRQIMKKCRDDGVSEKDDDSSSVSSFLSEELEIDNYYEDSFIDSSIIGSAIKENSLSSCYEKTFTNYQNVWPEQKGIDSGKENQLLAERLRLFQVLVEKTLDGVTSNSSSLIDLRWSFEALFDCLQVLEAHMERIKSLEKHAKNSIPKGDTNGGHWQCSERMDSLETVCNQLAEFGLQLGTHLSKVADLVEQRNKIDEKSMLEYEDKFLQFRKELLDTMARFSTKLDDLRFPNVADKSPLKPQNSATNCKKATSLNKCANSKSCASNDNMHLEEDSLKGLENNLRTATPKVFPRRQKLKDGQKKEHYPESKLRALKGLIRRKPKDVADSLKMQVLQTMLMTESQEQPVMQLLFDNTIAEDSTSTLADSSTIPTHISSPTTPNTVIAIPLIFKKASQSNPRRHGGRSLIWCFLAMALAAALFAAFICGPLANSSRDFRWRFGPQLEKFLKNQAKGAA